MKISIIKKIALPFFILPVIVFCKESVAKMHNTGNSTISTKCKIETVTKKEISSLPEKSNVKKWNTNAATAKITFKVEGLFGTVNGSLGGLKSTIEFDGNDLAASSILASVDPKTISTGISLRNNDLQKENYLNSDKYPLISFKSGKIQKSDTGYKVIGGLTIKGLAKQIEIPFSFSEKGNKGVFKGNFTIQREDYNVGKPGGSIGSTVTIELEVPVTN
jgi:polyisoprenoid-binding protein YceI